MRALDIESVLCLADRTPLGRVEEVHFSAYIDTSKTIFRSSGCCWLSCQANRTISLVLYDPSQVFGPVTKPLYALHYAGPSSAEEKVQAGAPVFVVQSGAVFVNSAEVQRPVSGPQSVFLLVVWFLVFSPCPCSVCFGLSSLIGTACCCVWIHLLWSMEAPCRAAGTSSAGCGGCRG